MLGIINISNLNKMKYHFIATLTLSTFLVCTSLPSAVRAIEHAVVQPQGMNTQPSQTKTKTEPTEVKTQQAQVKTKKDKVKHKLTKIKAQKVKTETQRTEVKPRQTEVKTQQIKADSKGIKGKPELNEAPYKQSTTQLDQSTTQPQPVAPTTQKDQPELPPSAEVISKDNTNLPPTAFLSSLELTTYNLVNKYRQSHSLPPLVIDPAISAQAKLHSNDMARLSYMSHDGFDQRTAAVSQTIVYRKAAENVAWSTGFKDPDVVAVKGWIESLGHQRNMLGPFDLTGIGVTKNDKGEYYFTQLFVKKAWYVKDMESPEEAKLQDALVNTQ